MVEAYTAAWPGLPLSEQRYRAEDYLRSLEELIENWRLMPMRNVELAARWGVGRQQVNKWRFQAMKMIEKRLL